MHDDQKILKNNNMDKNDPKRFLNWMAVQIEELGFFCPYLMIKTNRSPMQGYPFFLFSSE